jgi:hypothetical protein
VAPYLYSLKERYQQRAALALARFGGPAGRDALEGAVLDSAQYSGTTRVIIRRARDTALVHFP